VINNLTEISPVVSVIIPTYNQATFLSKAIESVINQTYINWELIVVNNYSSDNTEEIVKKYNDPRIRIINYRNYGIIAAPRNAGVSRAKGEYIAFLDSDDFWYIDKIAKSLCVLDGGADLVCSGEVWRKGEAELRRVSYGPSDKSDFRSLLFNGNCISTSAVVLKKSFFNNISGFSEKKEFVLSEDYDLWIKLAKNGCKIEFIDSMLGEYIIHGANNSSSYFKMMKSELNILNYHFIGMSNYKLFDALLYIKRFMHIVIAYIYKRIR